MRAIIAILICLVLAPLNAQTRPSEMAAEVADNVATEYAECSAFFSVAYGAFISSRKSAEAAKFKETSDKAALFSILYAKQSRSEEMAAKVTLARIEMSLKDMQRIIENNYSNMPFERPGT